MASKQTPDRELFELAEKYLGRVEALAKETTKAVNKAGSICDELVAARKKYHWLYVIIELAKIVLPIILPYVLFVAVAYSVPCGRNIEFGDLKITTDGCPSNGDQSQTSNSAE